MHPSTCIPPEVVVGPAPERLVTITDVCAALARSRASVYRDIKRRAFPMPIKQGASSRWLASDIASHIERCAAASRG